MEASDELEQRKNKGGGHMHGSISSTTTQGHSQAQKHGHGVHGTNSILHPGQSHRPKHTTSTSSAATPHVTLRHNGGIATRNNSLCVDPFAGLPRDSTGPLSHAETSEDRRRSKSIKRSMSISEINDISQLVGAAGMIAIFNAAGMTPPHPGHSHVQGGSGRRFSTAQSIGVGDRPGPHAPADMIFQHTEVDWDEAPSPLEKANADHQPFRTMENSHQTQSLPQLGVDSPTTHYRKDSNTGTTSSASHKHRSNSVKSRMDGANSFAAYLGFPQPSSKEKFAFGSPSIEEERARPQSAGPYDTLTSTGSLAGAGIACQEEEPMSSTSMCHATYHATPQKHSPQKHTHHQAHEHGHGQGHEKGHTSSAQRPHTANAAVRPSGPTHEELEEMERKEAARRHEAHKARRREELHAQAMKDKRRLCRSANNAFGLPKDVFHGVKDDVDSKIGLKFLRAMSSNPSIYDDVQVKKRASSSYGRTTRPPKSNIW